MSVISEAPASKPPGAFKAFTGRLQQRHGRKLVILLPLVWFLLLFLLTFLIVF